MAQFHIFMIGCAQPQRVELPVASLPQVHSLLNASRFLEGELVDAVDEEGVFTSPAALIPVSRIQMIVEERR